VGREAFAARQDESALDRLDLRIVPVAFPPGAADVIEVEGRHPGKRRPRVRICAVIEEPSHGIRAPARERGAMEGKPAAAVAGIQIRPAREESLDQVRPESLVVGHDHGVKRQIALEIGDPGISSGPKKGEERLGLFHSALQFLEENRGPTVGSSVVQVDAQAREEPQEVRGPLGGGVGAGGGEARLENESPVLDGRRDRGRIGKRDQAKDLGAVLADHGRAQPPVRPGPGHVGRHDPRAFRFHGGKKRGEREMEDQDR